MKDQLQVSPSDASPPLRRLYFLCVLKQERPQHLHLKFSITGKIGNQKLGGHRGRAPVFWLSLAFSARLIARVSQMYL